MASIEDLEIKRGNTEERQVTITRDRVPVALDGATLTLYAWYEGGVDDVHSFLLDPDEEVGKASLILSQEETTSFTPQRTYRYVLELVDAFGDVWTPVEGRLVVDAGRPGL